MTIFDKPILYIRVKKAKKVKIKGAIINSYSSRTDSMVRSDDGGVGYQMTISRELVEGEGFHPTICVFLSSTSFCAGSALPLLSPGTFRLLKSYPSCAAPEACAAFLVVIVRSIEPIPWMILSQILKSRTVSPDCEVKSKENAEARAMADRRWQRSVENRMA